VNAKMAVNRTRRWSTVPNADGIIEHIRDEVPA
jgi:hypothetical protein